MVNLSGEPGLWYVVATNISNAVLHNDDATYPSEAPSGSGSQRNWLVLNPAHSHSG